MLFALFFFVSTPTPSSAPASAPACEIEPAVCFSPGRCDANLVEFIDAATRTLDVAIYSLNRAVIVDALIRAKVRGVAVRMVTDRLQDRNRKERPELARLAAAGIPIKRNAHKGIMHLKVIVADGHAFATGSFNYTSPATEVNDENLLVWDCAKTAALYEAEFERLWATFKALLEADTR